MAMPVEDRRPTYTERKRRAGSPAVDKSPSRPTAVLDPNKLVFDRMAISKESPENPTGMPRLTPLEFPGVSRRIMSWSR